MHLNIRHLCLNSPLIICTGCYPLLYFTRPRPFLWFYPSLHPPSRLNLFSYLLNKYSPLFKLHNLFQDMCSRFINNIHTSSFPEHIINMNFSRFIVWNTKSLRHQVAKLYGFEKLDLWQMFSSFEEWNNEHKSKV